MDRSFTEERPFIENEFEEAVFDGTTGIAPAELLLELKRRSAAVSNEPRPIVCAKAFAFLLDNVQLQINPHTPFAVKLNFGIDYSEFATAGIFQKAFSPFPASSKSLSPTLYPSAPTAGRILRHRGTYRGRGSAGAGGEQY